MFFQLLLSLSLIQAEFQDPAPASWGRIINESSETVVMIVFDQDNFLRHSIELKPKETLNLRNSQSYRIRVQGFLRTYSVGKRRAFQQFYVETNEVDALELFAGVPRRWQEQIPKRFNTQMDRVGISPNLFTKVKSSLENRDSVWAYLFINYQEQTLATAIKEITGYDSNVRIMCPYESGDEAGQVGSVEIVVHGADPTILNMVKKAAASALQVDSKNIDAIPIVKSICMSRSSERAALKPEYLIGFGRNRGRLNMHMIETAIKDEMRKIELEVDKEVKNRGMTTLRTGWYYRTISLPDDLKKYNVAWQVFVKVGPKQNGMNLFWEAKADVWARAAASRNYFRVGSISEIVVENFDGKDEMSKLLTKVETSIGNRLIDSAHQNDK